MTDAAKVMRHSIDVAVALSDLLPLARSVLPLTGATHDSASDSPWPSWQSHNYVAISMCGLQLANSSELSGCTDCLVDLDVAAASAQRPGDS